MNHEKRFLIAIGLTVAFLYVWFEYFVPKPVPRPIEPVVTTSGEVTPSPTNSKMILDQTTSSSVSKVPVASIKSGVAKKIDEVDSDLWHLFVTNQPGSIEELRLLKYHQSVKGKSPSITTIPIGGPATEPFTWTLNVDGTAISDQESVYSVVESEKNRFVFQTQMSHSINVKKTLLLDPKSYASLWTVEILNTGKQSVNLGASTKLSGAITEDDKSAGGFFKPRHTPVRATSFINDQTHHWSSGEFKKDPKVPVGDIQWAGFDSQYFLLAAIPVQGRWESLTLGSANESEMQIQLNYPVWKLDPGKPLVYQLKLYAGPKDIDALRNVGQSLDRAIDLGDWLGLVARPMIKFLRFAHKFIPNYGVAIILLTILVRLLLTPFTHMQAKSMRKMQEHKPYMDELKEKYKDNKEAYSRELMTYMRSHKINPMGGCLLLLPQLPIFFALYRVLYNSIELRHEPFAFWIRDLAAHDPYFILPVLLGVAMFFQQKLTPSPSADDAQQMMMKIMPVMFTAFMLFLPAGLNLYILVSTLWGVAQQYRIQKGSMSAAQPLKKVSGS
ncbi:MAG: membrane protein insertase YidC [Bdellovibrionales bacterium]|nr:membrane protein insertase YidC [Bdellovibrionales bacterium]